MLLPKKMFLYYGCSLELRNTCPLIKEYNFIRLTFNPTLIVAIQSEEALHKEFLTGYIDYKKGHAKLF